MSKHIFQNKKVNQILQWWITNYEYEFLDTPNGILKVDLQGTEEDKIVTEKEIIAFFIEQIENKLHYIEKQDKVYSEWQNEIEVLKIA